MAQGRRAPRPSLFLIPDLDRLQLSAKPYPVRCSVRPVTRRVAFIAVLLVAGCSTPVAKDPTSDPTSFTPCADPFPCGTEWPVGLLPPFDAAEVVELELLGHDGIPLESFVHRPVLPEGVGAPVILFSTPYPGTCPTNGLGRCYTDGDDPRSSTRIDIERLVSEGYAVVVTNVRGTGRSGGCFAMGGIDEQLDQVALVEALAAAPWSNGRVAMLGHSYSSFTAWMAAVQAPPALKTIIVSGHMTDLYTFYHSPQGAATGAAVFFQTGYSESLGVPPVTTRPERLLDDPAVFAGRLCPEGQAMAAEPARGIQAPERDATIWDARRFLDELGAVRAAVLSVSGYEDDSGHAYQDDDVWRALSAPKAALFGHWGHDLPPPEGALDGSPLGSDWYGDILVPWLDFWLKGIGPPPADLGRVAYETSPTSWHATTAWPPADVREEVLYLAEGALRTLPAGAPSTFNPSAPTSPDGLCGDGNLQFVTEPLAANVALAGNPFAYLELTSDQPGGVLALSLLDLAPDAACGPQGLEGEWTYLTSAAADLRYHEGGYRPKDFPVGKPTAVRFDFHNDGWIVPEGHRLALFAGAAGARGYLPTAHAPTLTLGAGDLPTASQVVLPVVDGTFGGAFPTLAYPPHPRAP